ncbi:restriction endonuclease subunit S [Mycoplasma zalophi]|uniref:restriction endonuclease subunit S n=1 Tax=Mycoplasma zalophi TaxID=191287 RepID=UPI001C120884|nr:restriction endonuclease subunit S [Mycoplasma zalophi]MBU4690914.1 restriction endonuclease subunit S [Mycoplasma zalophi]
MKDIFDIPKIKKYSSIPENEGNIPFVSSTIENNSIVKYVDETPTNIKGVISITTNGVNAFTAKYQSNYACYSTDSEIIYSRQMNKYSAMFIVSILNLENYRYAYMRKPKNGLVGLTKIKLPIDKVGKPDWKFMEEYIKSLPYSKFI